MTQQQAKKIVRFGQLAKYHEMLSATSVMETIEVTWSELKALRDGGLLTAGQWYRITDYTCTTTQTDTQSAGHVFDIIVRADDVNVLNENAFAAHHAGDTYFANSKLEAWKLLYCLDNDTDRFAWADSTNGKGVIYWMKDEYDNECPYDFKNIMFARYQITAMTKVPELVNTYSGFKDISSSSATKYPSGATISDTAIYRYTFDYLSGTTSNDLTIYQQSQTKVVCHGNIIASWFIDNQKKRSLNNIVIGGNSFQYCYGNEFGENCRNNSFGTNMYGNSFGTNVYNNTIGNNFQNNTIGYNVYNNSIGNDFGSNSIGNGFYGNSIGNYFQNNSIGNSFGGNTIGNNVYNNSIGNNFQNNTIGNGFYGNSIGNYFQYNTIGNDFGSNSIGNSFQYNSIGNYFQYNTIGNYFSSNTIGNDVYNNSIGNNIRYTKTGTSSTTKDYCRYIIIEDGNQYLYLDCSATTSSSAYFQNVKIAQGVNNTSTYKTITHTTAGDTFQTVYKPANSVEVSV